MRSLKSHSGKFKITAGKGLPEQMLAESPQDVRAGQANLLKHIEIVRGFGMEPVVAINVFPTDHESELAEIEAIAREAGARVARSYGVVRGGEGCIELAQAVEQACQDSEGQNQARPLYEREDDLKTKIAKVAAMYGADGVDYTPAAAKLLATYQAEGFGELNVVVAKTPMSLSADPSVKGAPTGWRLPIREVRLAAGAGYVYAISGNLSTMPGLPSTPGAARIDVDTTTGEIHGLR